MFVLEKTEPPSWNFWKYLIDPNGKVIQAYSPQINVRQVYPDIKKLLIQYNLIDKSEL
jgi:glutathione peroxidase